ncbi:hypothetical protein [Egicoccus sp. AB-alg6-2]|uniref:DUF7305 domain-containing protein n=1 Tax=Egicoccus sp. AB-alg6-2 TaxID=3242692 RepID=UPI00359DB7CB
MLTRLHRDESGSLIMVLLASIVIGGLIVVVFSDVRTGQLTARSDRDFNQAIQVADAGVQRAFTQLALIEPDDPIQSLDEVLPIDGGETSWTATRVGETRWQVRSEGRFGEATRVVEATIGPHQVFSLAAFADLRIELRGGNVSDSYNATGTNRLGRVGSNNEITLRGNATVDWVMRYNNATYGEKGTVVVGVETVPEPAYLPNLGEQAYADDGPCFGRNDGAYTGQYRLVRGHTYCFSNVTFPAGNHQLQAADPPTTEPTRIYIAPSGTLRLEGQGNDPDCTKVACVNLPSGFNASTLTPRPEATALLIYLANGTVSANNHTSIAAGIYAPTSDCAGPNAQGDIYGSIVCRTLDGRGGWKFHYDERFRDVVADDFTVQGWREEHTGTTSFGSG